MKIAKIAFFIASSIALISLINSWKSTSEKEDATPVAEAPILKNKPRAPASAEPKKLSKVSSPGKIYNPGLKRASVDRSQFNPPFTPPVNESATFEARNIFQNSLPPIEESFQREEIVNNNFLVEKERSEESKKMIPPYSGSSSAYFKPPPQQSSSKKQVSIKSSSYNSSIADVNTCSSNFLSGAFNHPISVSLNCTSSSTIKYCLAPDTGAGCCDPTTSGQTYTAPVIVGSSNGNFCLSFYAKNSQGATQVQEHNFIINNTLPDLQASNPKTTYQTTQLAGRTLITSADFGKSGYGMGIINLMDHEPTANGLMNCEDIVTGHTSLVSPSSDYVLGLMDISAESASTQIEIPLLPNHLQYGDNFLTSYIVNNNFSIPLYSCATSKITLNDFEYYQSSEGLTPYGFFETLSSVGQGTSGKGSEDISGEILQNNMFAIFY